MKILFAGIRSACFCIEDGLYALNRPRQLFLNGADAGRAETCVFSLFHLRPGTDYVLETDRGERLTFRTAGESYTLDVRRFGAVGDGVHDDTAAIQAAIACCPRDGRVLIPAGDWLTGPLFLKSHIRLELRKGAVLRLIPDRNRFPILPGLVEPTESFASLDAHAGASVPQRSFGSWEGNPLDTFASLLTGVDVEDVAVFGEGVLDGGGDRSDWWRNHRAKRGAWRPRMVFLNRCKGVALQGLTLRNSPCWNLHPYFSADLSFLNLTILAPADSPNTDGFDPESCRGVRMAGAHFSLGDDCIAVKSGKLWMGQRFRTPCEDIEIAHCLMENGHGGVTIGSEMAGGVHDVRVRDCLMRDTDRGLRIKTRRGRGKQGVIDGVVFERVRMERVLVPLVVNALYYCDPDGHSPWVQSREKQAVDDSTPRIGGIAFRDVTAEDASCAGYVLGLPEQPVERVALENVSIRVRRDAPEICPAMADGVPKMRGVGLVVENTRELSLSDVSITGMAGEAVIRK